MKTLEEIERAIQELPPENLVELRAWFEQFDAEVWDRKLEEDVESGRLDTLMDEALQDLRSGRCTDL